MMLESVLEWLRLNQTLPSVSSAAIIDSLGATEFNYALPVPSFGAQVLRIKLVSLSQVSSMLMNRVPRSSNGRICIAYCYLAIMERSVLVPRVIFLALMKPNLHHSLIVYRASFSVTSRL